MSAGRAFCLFPILDFGFSIEEAAIVFRSMVQRGRKKVES
jgi:hypothetical protein